MSAAKAAFAPVTYDLDAAIAALTANDLWLARVVELAGDRRPLIRKTRNAYQALARAIVYQQLNGRAAASILLKMKRTLSAGQFPGPRTILAASEERMRSAGLSRAKTAALKDLAAKTLAGVVPSPAELDRMTDDEIVERLVTIRGIGRWTVEMLLIFHLGRPDVLPVDDFGVRNGFAITYGKRRMPTPKELQAHGQRWRPYRSVASWYMWRAVELAPHLRQWPDKAEAPAAPRDARFVSAARP